MADSNGSDWVVDEFECTEEDKKDPLEIDFSKVEEFHGAYNEDGDFVFTQQSLDRLNRYRQRFIDKNYANFEDKKDFDSLVAQTCVNAGVLLVCCNGTMCRPEDVEWETEEEEAARAEADKLKWKPC